MKEFFEPFLAGTCPKQFYGYLGKNSYLKASNGEKLFVGDIVKIDWPDGGIQANKAFVVHDTVLQDSRFDCCYFVGENNIRIRPNEGVRVKKLKSYQDLKGGEILGRVRVIVKPSDLEYFNESKEEK